MKYIVNNVYPRMRNASIVSYAHKSDKQKTNATKKCIKIFRCNDHTS